MNIELNKIKTLASKASKGNWTPFTKRTTVAVLIDNQSNNSIVNWPGFDSCDKPLPQQKANARYIAAVQPSVILELIAEIERLQGS